MAHVAKHTRVATGHLCAHYDRSAERISNENIDPARTKDNYNLGPGRELGQVDFINQRCREVRCHNRKDVNVMCSWVVTAPKDLPAKDNRKFFEETYKFLATRYDGEKNVVSAYVHMDEVTPHMHFAFVPVVADRRRDGESKVSAKEAVSRADVRAFHEDLEKHLAGVFGREVGILNEATREGNKSIAELKRGQAEKDLKAAKKELRSVQDDVKHLKDTEKGLQARIRGLEGQVLTMKGLEVIQPEKTLTGAIKGVTVEQVQDLKKTAMKYHEVKAEKKLLEGQHSDLKLAYQKQKLKVPTEQQKRAQVAIQIELRDVKRKLQRANDFIARIPDDMRKKMEQEMKKEQQRGMDIGR